MSSINNENLWNKLVSYTFGKMSVKEEQEMDDYLDQHQEAADIADSLLNYCEKEAIASPEMLDNKLQSDLTAAKGSFPSTKPRDRSYAKWVFGLLFFLLLIVAFLFYKKQSQDTPTHNIPRAGLIDFWEQEKNKLGSAGPVVDLPLWEQQIINQEFQQAQVSLEQLIQQGQKEKLSREIYYLCVLYLWDNPPAINQLEALLPSLSGSAYAKKMNEQIELSGLQLEEKHLPLTN